jgi:hypothetical protein
MTSPPEMRRTSGIQPTKTIMEQIRTKMKGRVPNRLDAIASRSGRYRLGSAHHSAASSATQVVDLAPRAILSLAATWLDPGLTPQRETIYQDEWLPSTHRAAQNRGPSPVSSEAPHAQ